MPRASRAVGDHLLWHHCGAYRDASRWKGRIIHDGIGLKVPSGAICTLSLVVQQ
jgi:hypothetical protein